LLRKRRTRNKPAAATAKSANSAPAAVLVVLLRMPRARKPNSLGLMMPLKNREKKTLDQMTMKKRTMMKTRTTMSRMIL
jgi:hypothetical protein